MDNYMAIYPLWSGVLLGNLKRNSSDKAEALSSPLISNTRDTNFHVEKWFGIVKIFHTFQTQISQGNRVHQDYVCIFKGEIFRIHFKEQPSQRSVNQTSKAINRHNLCRGALGCKAIPRVNRLLLLLRLSFDSLTK